VITDALYYVQYRDGVGNSTENSYLLPHPNALVAIIKGMRAVKHFT